MATNQISNEIYKIYCENGQSKAFDFADKCNLDFEYCKACETESPIDRQHTCLICGQSTKSNKVATN